MNDIKRKLTSRSRVNLPLGEDVRQRGGQGGNGPRHGLNLGGNVIFNTHYYGGPVNDKNLHWCVAFVWDIFRLAGATGLFYGGKKTASCGTLWAYHKGQGQAVTDFQPGDVVFFDFSGKRSRTEHVGIVGTACRRKRRRKQSPCPPPRPAPGRSRHQDPSWPARRGMRPSSC